MSVLMVYLGDVLFVLLDHKITWNDSKHIGNHDFGPEFSEKQGLGVSETVSKMFQKWPLFT